MGADRMVKVSAVSAHPEIQLLFATLKLLLQILELRSSEHADFRRVFSAFLEKIVHDHASYVGGFLSQLEHGIRVSLVAPPAATDDCPHHALERPHRYR